MKKRLIVNTAILAFQILAISFFLIYPGQAQVRPKVGLNSMSDSMRLAPGSSYKGSFKITNHGQEPTEVSIKLIEFDFTKGGKFQPLEVGSLPKKSLARYLTFKPKEVVLQSGETREVRYSLELPNDVDQNPRWAALAVQPKSSTETSSTSEGQLGFRVNLQFNYAYRIIQQPINSPQPSGKISSIRVEGTTEGKEKNLNVSSTFVNTSPALLKCDTYIEVRNEDGESLLRYDFPSKKIILPNKKRVFSHTFTDVGMDPGRYVIISAVDYGGDNIVAGQYIATVGKE